MGVQQSRRSKSRTGRKRAVWLKMDKPGVMECPQCKAVKLPHRVCGECGYYKGREVLANNDQAKIAKAAAKKAGQ